ncbi:MAG: hypothetical protein HC901_03450 [Bdellovibrionaceae bacterium]|nr:hypothetical protein [Pseudobdellovibrionaceae bacterium]
MNDYTALAPDQKMHAAWQTAGFDAPRFLLIGQRAYAEQAYPEALAWYELGLQTGERMGELWYHIGLVRVATRAWEPALAALEQASATAFNNRDVQYELGKAQAALRNREAALAAWQFRWMPYAALLLAAAAAPPLASLTYRSFQHAAIALALWLLAGLGYELAHQHPPHTQAALHEIAGVIDGGGVILAPWWQSAQLLYETGCPVVGTSAHTGWNGIVDTCRFYAGADFPAARGMLDRLGVRWIVIWNPEELIPLSRRILGISSDPPPLLLEVGERFHLITLRLWENTALSEEFIPVFADPASDFRVYRYNPLTNGSP